MNFDLPLFRAINSFARSMSWLHGPMLAYATYGVVVIAILLWAGWWVARRHDNARMMAAALWAPLATLLAVGINQPIVAAVHEARPYDTVQGILVLANRSTDPSFPSDHAVMAGAAVAGILLVTRGALAWVAVAAGLLLAFSRVYIAAHYPHDVLVGLALGAVVAVAGYLLLRRPLTAVVEALERTRLRPLLTVAATPHAERV
jgi:membrane-associated phospholipid phosphatase